jgi:superfamily II DNA or RNA helicase
MKEATSTSGLKISKEFLLEIGGWRTFQEGRALQEGGKVLSWSYEAPMLSGVVQTGTSTVNARLKLGQRLSDVENLCSCRQAREYGTICPHVIAVGLTALLAQTPSSPAGGHDQTGSHGRKKTDETDQPVPLRRLPVGDAPADTHLLEIQILLPTALTEAWKKGQMRIILEGSVDGQPFVPLDAVPRTQGTAYAMYDHDAQVLSTVERICGGQAPGMWMLPQASFGDFFASLINHRRVFLGKKTPFHVERSPEPNQLLIDILDDGDLRLRLNRRGPAGAGGEVLQAPGCAWRLKGGQLELLDRLPPAYSLLRQQDIVLPRSEVGHFFQNELPVLDKQVDVVMADRAKGLQFTKLNPRIRITLDGLLAGLNCRIEAIYGTSIHMLQGFPNKNERSHDGWTPDPENILSYFVRDRDAERAAQREVLAAGFQPGQRNADLYTLATENKVGAFLANILPRWRTRWEVVYSGRMDGFLSKCDFIRPEITIQSSGQDWLALDVEFQESSGRVQMTQAEVQRLLRTGVSHHRMADGRIALLPTDSVSQFNEVLYDCQVQGDQNGWRLNKKFASYLQGILQTGDWIISNRSDWRANQEVQQFQAVTLDDEAEKRLRPYQKTGVSWLHYLARNGFGGILADEMGLGKTLQTLTYIQYRKRNRLSTGPSLVVGPTSLVRNWMAEAARFTPDLSVMALHGAGRHVLFREVPKHDLVITSYSLLRRDISELQKLEIDTLILDEAQNIKNRASQNAQAAKALNASNRLVLTGTPVENSLLDLWSIFDFLMPGYLGAATEFRDRYEVPIAKAGDAKALARLQQRIRPFVLRRTKAEVAKDLPAKLEQISYCELTEEQKGVYQAILEQGRREVQKLSGKGSGGKDRLAVLTALTRLRQVCCHLHLLPAVENREWKEPSAKMDYFMELLDEAMDGGHRVLVFSQFVSLLRLIEGQIKQRSIEYCYLDGATTERLAVVNRFQENTDIPVFLISLKAGGTGLNLTGADTVIHFDPWWNPAVEDQATARAHRMGQSRIVTSYKLIARGTVEEKIVQLQQRKKDLIHSALVSEEAFIHSLSWEELQGLLE